MITTKRETKEIRPATYRVAGQTRFQFPPCRTAEEFSVHHQCRNSFSTCSRASVEQPEQEKPGKKAAEMRLPCDATRGQQTREEIAK